MFKKKSFLTKITGAGEEDLVEEQQDEAYLENISKNSAKEPPAQAVEKETKTPASPSNEEWLEEEYEGQLSVDVYQTKDDIVIKSTIAGIKPEDLDVSINNDMVTIKGKRVQEKEVKEEDYFYQECYWGGFSRSIILPVEVKAEDAKAQLKNGVLTIRLPKAKKSKSISVKINEEE